ncbi:MAG: MotA/TolQ/ExbB proton channel family protein [Candidatus Electryoneaceae bacterium]|nr:MotA/TolQ/ExbB proton channel family protein [Candidatus Electryoneaceae bacterium]
MVDYFIKGGNFMWPILFALIIGIMFSLERFWTLTRATINARKFTKKVKDALDTGGTDKAIDVCQNTRGPIANVVQAGLIRAGRGIEAVEKAIMSSGTIEMAFLERNLVWLATVVSLAPMLGFLGTVSGMVGAFDSIAKADDISPALVAGGISEALLTTMFGLIVAIIVQFTHNFFVARIDKIVADMEESTQEFVDMLVDREEDKKA